MTRLRIIYVSRVPGAMRSDRAPPKLRCVHIRLPRSELALEQLRLRACKHSCASTVRVLKRDAIAAAKDVLPEEHLRLRRMLMGMIQDGRFQQAARQSRYLGPYRVDAQCLQVPTRGTTV